MLGLTPFPDESPIGFIFRLADRQRRVSGNAFAKKLGMPNLRNWPSEGVLEALSAASDLPISELKKLTFGLVDDGKPHFRGHLLPSTVFKLSSRPVRMVCPLCLDDSYHHRAIWDLVFINACPVHNVRLEGFCPDCGRDLKWWACYPACICGAEVMNRASPRLIDADDLDGLRGVHGLLGDDRFSGDADKARRLRPFVQMTDGEIVDFLWRIGLESRGGRPNILSVEHPREHVVDAHLALKEGLAVARSWPDAFTAMLTGLIPKWKAARVYRVSMPWAENLEAGPHNPVADVIQKWRNSATSNHGPGIDG